MKRLMILAAALAFAPSMAWGADFSLTSSPISVTVPIALITPGSASAETARETGVNAPNAAGPVILTHGYGLAARASLLIYLRHDLGRMPVVIPVSGHPNVLISYVGADAQWLSVLVQNVAASPTGGATLTLYVW